LIFTVEGLQFPSRGRDAQIASPGGARIREIWLVATAKNPPV
jgi:hypothetical protein